MLRTHDRFGNRIDEVEFHPAWHALMDTAVSHGLHAAPWADPRPGAHVARAAKFYVWTQAEAGHGCPISMTYAAVPALRHAPDLAARFEPLLAACAYDPGCARPRQAGPAVRHGHDREAGRLRRPGQHHPRGPVPAAGEGAYLLTGHKWFCSAPMCDVFLTLAQGPAGLTCFLLPRVLPDGARNRLRMQRLKDKLGNRSNASAEIEFDGALAWQVGEPGRGVATIIEMVSATRLDCVIGSAAGIRAATVAAVHHASHRLAFGKELVAQPLMANVLADLRLESQAATALAFRLAGAADRAARGDAGEAALLRVALPAAKYWVCKRSPVHAAEALECLGGNGYVEESGMPRLYREAPLNSIWEGSGNVTSLDVLRALAVRGRGRRAARRTGRRRGRGGGPGRRHGRPEGTADRAGGGEQPGGATRGQAAGRADRGHPGGGAAGAARAGRGRRRVLRVAARPDSRRARWSVRHVARAARPGGDHRPGPGRAPGRGLLMRVWPGAPIRWAPPGTAGTNFALFSEVVEAVELCLLVTTVTDQPRPETPVALTEVDGLVWHGYLPDLGPGSATATGCTALRIPSRDTGATRRSSCSTRTGRRWMARSAGTRPCSGTASTTRPAPTPSTAPRSCRSTS